LRGFARSFSASRINTPEAEKRKRRIVVIVGVPKEIFPGERRVALVPLTIPILAKAGLEIIVETGAGAEAGYPDADFAAKGAKIVASRAEIFSTAEIIVQVLCYGAIRC
jgi:H+-translocating NAD(P) transhydrogenase subunit alpha